MDAIALLKADHEGVDQLFSKFEAAGPRAFKTKRQLVDKMISKLAVHAAIEEQVFYPFVRKSVPALDGDVLEGIEEHHIVKWTLSELQDLKPEKENFDPKVTVLIETVRHHVAEEEGSIFPEVRKHVGRKALDDLGEALAAAKKAAPTHPHPRSPSTPPGNVVTGAITGVIDKALDAGAAAVGVRKIASP